jgi:hypothetical protein
MPGNNDVSYLTPEEKNKLGFESTSKLTPSERVKVGLPPQTTISPLNLPKIYIDEIKRKQDIKILKQDIEGSQALVLNQLPNSERISLKGDSISEKYQNYINKKQILFDEIVFTEKKYDNINSLTLPNIYIEKAKIGKNKEEYANIQNELSQEYDRISKMDEGFVKEKAKETYNKKLSGVLKQQNKIIELKNSNKDIIEIENKRQKLVNELIKQDQYVEQNFNKNYDNVFWYKPESEKLLKKYRESKNELSIALTGKPMFKDYTDELVKDAVTMPDITVKEAINPLSAFLIPLKFGKNINAATKLGSKFFLGETGLYKGLEGYRDLYKFYKKSADQYNKVVSANIPEGKVRDAFNYGSKRSLYIFETTSENVGSSIGRNPVGTGLLAATSYFLGGLSTLKYIPLSEASYTGLTTISTDIFSGNTLQELNSFDLKKLDVERSKGIMSEYSYYQTAKIPLRKTREFTREVPFLRDMPFFNKYLRNKEAYMSGISKDLSPAERKYVNTLGVTSSVSKDVVSVALLGERLSEVKGQTKFFNLVKNKPLDIAQKNAFKTSFKESFKVIQQVAPVEVYSTYIPEKRFLGQEVDYGELAYYNVYGSNLAGAIGGTIVGTQAKFISTNKKGYDWISRSMKLSADIGERGAENIGDWLADFTSPETSLTKTSKGIKIYVPTKVNTNIKNPLQSNTKTSNDFLTQFKTNNKINTLLSTESKTNAPSKNNINNRLNNELSTNIKSNNRINTNIKQSIKTPLNINQNINSNIKQPTNIKNELLTNLPTNTQIPAEVNTPVNVPINIVVSDKLTPFPFIPKPNFNLALGLGPGKRKKNKLKTRYTASFDAIAYGIFTKKKPSKSIYTGDETRAIYDPTGKLYTKTKSRVWA